MAFALYLPLCLLLLLLLPNFAFTQNSGDLTVGDFLTTASQNSSWLSPSGDFAFGFQQLENQDLFLLSIWFDKIPEKTIVWYANGDNPAPSGSKVMLTADNGLVLSNPTGEEIWRSLITNGQVSHGVMQDTGNFMLVSSNSSTLWQSFDHPTDTLLPTQSMEIGGTLLSRRTNTNFWRGRFQLRLLETGNLVINPINLQTNSAYNAYYVSGTSDSRNSSNSGFRVVFTDKGALYVLKRNGDQFFLTQVTAPNYYQRATLNFDGVFAQYSHSKTLTGSTNWTITWPIPDNICAGINGTLGSGACGYNSICSLDANRRPVCSCPPGFSLLDSSDTQGSCKPDFDLSCREDMVGFKELSNVDWPTSDYDELRPFSENECRNSCLHDCLCAVAIFRNKTCWKKKLPLSNGRQDESLNGKAFVKIKQDSSLLGRRKIREILIITVSVLFCSSVFINFVFCLRSFFFYRKKLKTNLQEKFLLETNVRCFSYKELSRATDEFRQELGRGAFGVVYKGVMPFGSTRAIAVKALNGVVEDGEKEFRTEVNVVGQTHHKNLVQFLGFCDEGRHRILVYEYLTNGTLAEMLFGNSKPSWSLRTDMASGIARGLLYLHEECSMPIIHCDIKPQNVLLDDNYNPRISDFGFAKLLMMDQSQTITNVRGTTGYIAPEWFRRATITVKVDVYSFGVMLLEIVSCRRFLDTKADNEEAILIDWAYDCYREGTMYRLVDDVDAMNDQGNVERLVKIAIWCVQDNPSLRPTMRRVTQMLEGVLEVPVPPSPYLFITDT